MLRFFDILFSVIGLMVFAPIFLFVALIGYIDTGSPLFRQERVGQNRRPFVLVKFRTMKRNALSVATHLADTRDITLLGGFLRKSKLDELPQLWNVLKGDMSLVGPRPCLLSQLELIEERSKRNVYSIKPGITGLAQIRKIDMSTPVMLAETDKQLVDGLNIITYFHYIFLTIFGKGLGDRVKNP